MAVGLTGMPPVNGESQRSDSETLAPLGATRIQDGTAATCFHTHTKSVSTLAAGN